MTYPNFTDVERLYMKNIYDVLTQMDQYLPNSEIYHNLLDIETQLVRDFSLYKALNEVPKDPMLFGEEACIPQALLDKIILEKEEEK